MNTQHPELEVKEGVLVPDVGIEYPSDNPYTRLFHPEYVKKVVVDENYPFLDDSLLFKFQNITSYYFVYYCLDQVRLRLRYGPKYFGREIFKKYKKEFANGAITISNHCVPNDCECVMLGRHAKHTTRFPIFAPNLQTKDSYFIRTFGGVPIPPEEAGMKAMKKFNEAFDEFHRRGYWFHVFPEQARWDYYKPLRPFIKGAFTMAYKYKMPIIPTIITFRERTGIHKHFAKLPNEPLLNITFLEPLFPDTSKPRHEEVERMRQEAFNRMQDAAGIIKNPWKNV